GGVPFVRILVIPVPFRRVLPFGVPPAFGVPPGRPVALVRVPVLPVPLVGVPPLGPFPGPRPVVVPPARRWLRVEPAGRLDALGVLGGVGVRRPDRTPPAPAAPLAQRPALAVLAAVPSPRHLSILPHRTDTGPRYWIPVDNSGACA